jgi:pimeloyl-ACP methyl ester carboxylesterase
VSIAYQALGDGRVDLVIVPGFVSHLEIQWRSRPHRRFLERLAEGGRVIRYDKRGTGLSDPVARAPTLEQRVADLRVVLDAVDSDRAVLLGYSEGGPTAIGFAVDALERTEGLILYGTSSRPPPLWFRDRFRELIADWGQGTSLDMFAPSLASESSSSQREAAGAFERAGASPAMARHCWRRWSKPMCVTCCHAYRFRRL